MGTFGGHALPGSFFILFAVWWTINIFRCYYQSLLKNGSPYRNSATFPCLCLCGRLAGWELEGFLKIFFALVGFLGEVITGTSNGKFVHLGNGQHATMFFFFGMTGVIDLLLHHKVPLPQFTNYISMALALIVECVLFKFHLHGRADLDVLLHTLLLYVIYANIISLLIEIKFRKSVISGLARTFFVFVQGTWFWQVGFILYNPIPGASPWDLDSHEHMMIASMIFAWHLGGVFIIMLFIGGVIGCLYRCRGRFEKSSYDALKMQLVNRRSNGHTIINMQDEDTESDVEFQQQMTNPE